MGKLLNGFITILMIAYSIFHESEAQSSDIPSTQVTSQDSTKTHIPSSTASMSNHSTSATKSTSTASSAHGTISKSPETSIHLTSASSQSHTSTTTEQNHTTLLATNSSGTTKHTSVTTIRLSTKEPGSSNQGEDSLARNPGLVAILCIFFIILALVLVVVITKLIKCLRTSEFERLDDLPMNKMNEDAPFARQSSK